LPRHDHSGPILAGNRRYLAQERFRSSILQSSEKGDSR
jgi:hypothetical protein